MKCPVCTQIHSDRTGNACSHGALVVYTSAQCPICLEDVVPMVALPCGHLLCKADFAKLGGYMTFAETRVDADRYVVPEQVLLEDSDEEHVHVLPSLVRLTARQRVEGGWDLREVVNNEAHNNWRRTLEQDDDDDDDSSDDQAMLLPPLALRRRFSNSSDSSVDFLSSSSSSDWCEEESDEQSSLSSDDSSEEEYWDTSSSDDSHVLFVREESDSLFRANRSTGTPRSLSPERTRLHDSSSSSSSSSTSSSSTSTEQGRPTEPLSLFALPHLYADVSQNQRKQLRGGSWLLVPTTHTDSMLVYSVEGQSYTVDAFTRACRLIRNDKDAVFVQSPSGTVAFANLTQMALDKYNVPRQAQQVVSDGHGGIWTLHGGKRKEEKQLMFFNFRCRRGRTICKLAVSSCYLISDKTGGVWIHVQTTSGEDSLDAGLWHITTKSRDFVSTLDKDTKCLADGNGGVWTLSPPSECPECHGKRCILSRVCDGVLKAVLKIHVTSDAVKLVSDGKDGVYIHDLDQRRWKLYHWSLDGEIKEVCNLPRNARIVGDGDGGAWLLYRSSPTCPFRTLMHVSRQGRLEYEQAFELGTLLPHS